LGTPKIQKAKSDPVEENEKISKFNSIKLLCKKVAKLEKVAEKVAK